MKPINALILMQIFITMVIQGSALGKVSSTEKVSTTEIIAVENLLQPMEFNIPKDDLFYMLNLYERAVFPSHNLHGQFRINNLTTDTLFFVSRGKSWTDYLNLEYYYLDDSGQDLKMGHAKETVEQSQYQIFQCSQEPWPQTVQPVGRMPLKFSDYTRLPTRPTQLVSDSIDYYLPPNGALAVKADIPWTELTKLRTGNVRFRWAYDNLSTSKSSQKITTVHYEGRVISRILKINLQNRLDSLYYLNSEAQNYNSNELFTLSAALCTQILKMDSTNLDALDTYSDVLWKTNQFEAAIPYAERGYEIIKLFSQKYPIIADAEEADIYLQRFDILISRCKKHEKWKWAK
jgi:hypothetical protein